MLRALHPFRWLHAYGVFPPHTAPSAQMVPVVEASWDSEDWTELRYPFSPTQPGSGPRWCAPHHQRGDQAIIYEAFGANDGGLLYNLVGSWKALPVLEATGRSCDPPAHAGG